MPTVACALSILFFACNKDIQVNPTYHSNPDSVFTSASSLRATIAGDSFIATQADALVNDTMLFINGRTSKGDRITLAVRIPNPIVGIFEINEVTKNFATYQPVPEAEYLSNSFATGGQIRIMAVDTVSKKITGTFFFQGKQAVGGKTAVVTSGEFKISYTVSKTPPSNLNDTIYSNNPKSTLNDMFAVIKNGAATDSVTFQFTESFKYLGNLHFSGYNIDKKRIMIACDPKATGSLSLTGNFGPNSAYYVAPMPNGQLYTSEQGTLNITLNDTVQRHLVGTFTFSAKLNGSNPPDTRDVTSGSFSFYY